MWYFHFFLDAFHSNGCPGIWEVTGAMHGHHEAQHCELWRAVGHPLWESDGNRRAKCIKLKITNKQTCSNATYLKGK